MKRKEFFCRRSLLVAAFLLFPCLFSFSAPAAEKSNLALELKEMEEQKKEFVKESLAKYEKILQAKVKKPVSQDYQPAAIFRDDVFLGLGTLAAVSGQPRLLTCANLFPASVKLAVYTFQPLFAGPEAKGGIEKLSLFSPKAERQRFPSLIICRPGLALILAGLDERPAGRTKNFSLTSPLKEKLVFQSLITGKRHEALMAMDNPRGEKGIIFRYDFIAGHGDSGSGFVDEKGGLIIFDGSVKLSFGDRQRMGLPQEGDLAFGYLLNPKSIKQ